MSEWGNPSGVMPGYPLTEYIGLGKRTRGSETSQYPQEEKEISILKVAASEMGRAQTQVCVSPCALHVGGCRIRVGGLYGDLGKLPSCICRRMTMERSATAGDSPVVETDTAFLDCILSTAGHVESCGKLGGPSPKAKYYLATDSEPVP